MRVKVNKDSNHYSVIVVGGGIVGAGIFRDLSLHNQRTLLIDKYDFSSQTSQSSSKMLHGGIRYLENMDLELVKEALFEKNLWLKLAPHLCYENHFCIPVYKDSLRPLWMISVGTKIYDLLSKFKNSSSKYLNRKDTIKAYPELKESGLKGSSLYADAIVDDAKLTLEVIYDGLENPNCEALNYTELVSHRYQHGIHYIRTRDTIDNSEKEFSANHIVFATGPFTDKLLCSLDSIKWCPQLLPSKGSHIWISKNKLPLESPVVLTPKDGRVIFVIPQDNRVLIGTTEVDCNASFFNCSPDQEEIDYLISNINEYFDKCNLTANDILSSFAGIRPLVKEDGSDKGKTAREHKIFRPLNTCHVIIGGKYTTFRVMASQVVSEILHMFDLPYDNKKTIAPLRRISQYLPFQNNDLNIDQLKNILEFENVRTFQDLVVRRLGKPTSSHWIDQNKILNLFKENFELLNSKLNVSIDEINKY